MDSSIPPSSARPSFLPGAVPKERAAQWHQLSDDSAAALGRVLPRLCRAVLKATGATAYNVLQNNGADAHQAVMHVHFHIIPKLGDGRGLELEWKPQHGAHDRLRLRVERLHLHPARGRLDAHLATADDSVQTALVPEARTVDAERAEALRRQLEVERLGHDEKRHAPTVLAVSR